MTADREQIRRDAPMDLDILQRTRERAQRIRSQNASNSAKALARDALELCDLVDDFREELLALRRSRVGRFLRV